MKSDLSKVKVGDKIWTIQDGWTKVIAIEKDNLPIITDGDCYTNDGKRFLTNKYPSAFIECPFKEEPIKRDTPVCFRNNENECWSVGYYSHFDYQHQKHCCYVGSKKSTETSIYASWNIVTTENPLSC